MKYRPEREGALVLPHYTFALEVVARIGELRYREHQTVEEIADELRQGGMSISIKEVQLLSEVFLALVETCLKDDQEALKELEQQGGIVLALDGIQPEKGNETLSLAARCALTPSAAGAQSAFQRERGTRAIAQRSEAARRAAAPV